MLRIEGLVAVPRHFSFDELAAVPEQIHDIGTVVRGRVGIAVPVAALLAAAGVRAGATRLAITSRDGGFDAAVPLAAAAVALLV